MWPFLCCLFFGCRQVNEKTTSQEKSSSASTQESRQWDISIGDTLTAGKKFLCFRYDTAGNAIGYWGRKDTLGCENFGEPFGSYSPPWYFCEWKSHMGLRAGCGTGCAVLIILPMKKSGKIIYLNNDILVDTAGNRVFYAENLGKEKFMVMNIVTGYKKRIPMTLQKEGYFKEAIDSVRFLKNSLYVKWIDSAYHEHEQTFGL